MSEADLRDRLARSYEGFHVTPGDANYIARHARRYARMLHHLPTKPGALLDVGCFPGHLSVLAADAGWKVTGVSKVDGAFVRQDFVERMRAGGIDVLDVDMERGALPLPADSFECVFFNETIEHLPFNPFHALDQIWRVLRPGGLLVFSVPNLASFDHVWALLRGRSFHPELSRPLGESFHADIGQRHIREYTPGECLYLLAGQDKYLYRFDVESLVMDRGWDGMFYTEDGYRRTLRGVRPGTMLRELLTRVLPALRSNIVIRARKCSTYVRPPAECIRHEGFHGEETAGVARDFVRAPLRARWTGGCSEARVLLPRAMRRVRQVEMLMWMPAPPGAPSRRVDAALNGVECDALRIGPSNEPSRRLLKPAGGRRVEAGDAELTISLRSETWSPADFGSSDDRRLGVMTGVEQVAVVEDAE
jgi:SAM-dependent methyltransferase